MFFGKLLLSLLIFFIVPCYAPNPTVTVSRGITEEEVKDVQATLGVDLTTTDTFDFWKYTFHKEALRMLPYALSLLSTLRWKQNEGTILKKKDVHIGAIVSISGNGGGIFNLMAFLKKRGYTNLTIIVIVNIKENENQSSRGDSKAFDKIKDFGEFTNAELFWLEDNKTASYHSFQSVNVDEVVEKLKQTSILFDGICGGGYEATTLEKNYKRNATIEKALKILPAIAPANTKTDIKIVSHATPSGRTEEGKWTNSTEFVCYSIMSTTFPLYAIQVDRPVLIDANNAEQIAPPENVWLLEGPQEKNPATGQGDSFFTALVSEVPTMIDDFEALIAAIKPTTKWINVNAK